MLAVMTEKECERCGWWQLADGSCGRESMSGDTCEMYAWADVELVVSCDGWSAPRVSDLISTRAPIALRPVPATVYAKRADVVAGFKVKPGTMSKLARYRPAVAPTWHEQWSLEQLKAMGQGEHSEEWRRWYAAMPARMTAKQEREYFLRGPVK